MLDWKNAYFCNDVGPDYILNPAEIIPEESIFK